MCSTMLRGYLGTYLTMNKTATFLLPGYVPQRGRHGYTPEYDENSQFWYPSMIKTTRFRTRVWQKKQVWYAGIIPPSVYPTNHTPLDCFAIASMRLSWLARPTNRPIDRPTRCLRVTKPPAFSPLPRCQKRTPRRFGT